MHRWKLTGVATIVALTLFTTAVHAFDGNRKGFILGGGLGPALTSLGQGYDDPLDVEELSARENELGLATDFKIGGGITEKFSLYYVNNVSWVRFSGVTIAQGTGGLGATYYMEVSAPSLYFVGMIGMSSLWFFFGGVGGYPGFGMGGGVGYEFAKHWSVEGVATWGHLGLEVESINAFSFLVTVSGIAY